MNLELLKIILKRLLLLLQLLLLFSSIKAQITTDTASTPYWIDMMQDRSVNLHQTQRAFELYWQGKAIDKASGFKPFKRWEYMMQHEADANGNLPDYQTLYDAIYRYYDSLSGSILGLTFGSAPCLTEGNWKEIGPTKIPGNRTSQPNGMGRVNAIAFHPTNDNIIYLGAPAGGLWKSIDKGKNWTSNTDTMPTLGVSSIAINPKNPDVIYIGTGDRDASDAYSRGVMKSTDGGNAWKWANTTMGNSTIGCLIMDPDRPDTLLAATNNGIYRTTNGSNTWVRTNNTGNFKDIVFKPSSTDTVYATRNGLFYRSIDNGVNWTNITSGLPSGAARCVLAVSAANPAFIYITLTNSANFNSLCLSTDGGSTFKVMSTSPNIMDYSNLGTGTGGQAWYDLDMAADPKNAAIIYVGGVNIFKSTDSGTTWKINAHWVGTGAPNIHADQHALEFNTAGDILYAGNDGGIYYTANGGTNWIDISQGLGIAQIYRLGQSATNQNMVINGYQDNGTGLYDNGNWYTVMGGDGMDCVIDPSDPTWSYSDLYYGDVRRYKNGSFNSKIAADGTNGINEAGAWVTPFILQEGTPSTMFIGYKNIWRSTNANAGSVTWTKISNNLGGSNSQNIDHLENSMVDPSILYVSRYDNKFFRTNNANAATPTWTDLTANLPSAAKPDWIETHNKIANRVYIILNNKVYRSDNAGNSWTNISNGLPAIPLLSLVLDTSSKKQGMYLGTYMGVFYTDTTMSGWTWFNKGMPINTRVMDVEVFYHPNGRKQSHVVCATYGRGNWRSPLYDEDPLQPVALFKSDKPKVCANQPVTFYDTSLNAPTAWYWQISPNTFAFVAGSDSSTQNPTIQFLQKGTYTIKMYAENCVGVDSITKIAYIKVEEAITPAKCDGVTTITGTNYKIGIFSVSVDAFTKADQGTYEEGGYMDMACSEIMQLKTDTTYFIKITTGVNYKENVKVFIDFNNNGDLSDIGEMVFNGPKQLVNHNDSIKIPALAVTNTLIRMRVMSDYDSVMHACDTLNYGQTQDYGVVLIPRLPEPYFYADTNLLCGNNSVTFYDTSKGNVTAWDWNFGNGAVPAMATGKGPHLVKYSTPGPKTAVLTLNGGLIALKIDSIVSVNSAPNVSLTQTSGTVAFCEGASFALKTTDSSYLTSSFKWHKNNVSFAPAIDSLVSVTIATIADSGTYYVVKNYNGCSDTSNLLHLMVYPMPKILPKVDSDTNCFMGKSFNFTSNATLRWGTMTLNWDFSDATTSTLTNPLHLFPDIGPFNIKLTAISNWGCKVIDSLPIEVLPTPVSQFTLNGITQCLKDNNFSFTNTSYIGVGTLNYIWEFGDGKTSSSKDAAHQYTLPGTYNVKLIAISAAQCSDTAITLVEVTPQPVAQINLIDTVQCFKNNSFNPTSGSTIIGGSITGLAWNWGDGTLAVGAIPGAHVYATQANFKLQLVAISDFGCTDTTIKQIQVKQDAIADFTINDSSQCLNNNNFELVKNISADVTSSSFVFSETATENPIGSDKYHFSYLGNIQATLIANNSSGCADSATKILVTLADPLVNFDVDEVCLGDTTSFTNLSDPGKYTWLFGDGTQSKISNPTHVYLLANNYDVSLIVEAANGCIDTLIMPAIAIVNPIPKAKFNVDLTTLEALKTEVQLTNLSTNANSYYWDLGKFGTATTQNPNFEVYDTANLLIQLIASNDFGCIDSASMSIFIQPELKIFVPNSFTPNGDFLNDEFKPQGVRFATDYTMKIYNRWGEAMFETTNTNKGWDGNYKGKAVQPGVFVYIIQYIDSKGERQEAKGTIRLIK